MIKRCQRNRCSNWSTKAAPVCVARQQDASSENHTLCVVGAEQHDHHKSAATGRSFNFLDSK